MWNAFNPLPPLQERSLFLLLLFALLFVQQASGRARSAETMRDLVWCALSLVVFGYVVLNHEEIAL